MDADRYVANGQFSILTSDAAYMRAGVFDPAGMISLLEAETEAAVAEGYSALRVTGEMSWALRGLPGSERLIEYETLLNDFFPGSRCLAICQYDARRFTPEVLLQVLLTHPIAVVGTAIYDNFYYVSPAELLSDDQPTAQLRHWTQNLADQTLINTLNSAVNRGDSLQEAIDLLSEGIKEILSSDGATLYLLSEDKEYLLIKNLTLPPTLVRRIEGIIGRRIPEMRIRLSAGSLYRQILEAGKPLIINDAQAIRRLMAECTENKVLKKLVGRIQKTLEIGSVVSVPLVVEGEVLGLLGASRAEPFSESDLRRLVSVSGQLIPCIQRKRMDEALRDERDRAQKYLDVAGVMFVGLDAAQQVTLVNRKACEVLGYEEKQIIGKNWFDTCLPERLRHEVRVVFARLVAGEIEPVEYFENPILTRRGEERIIAWHNAVLRNKKGGIVGILSSGEDITERKRAEEELRKHREHLEEMVDERTAELAVARDKAEAADRVKSVFLATMSHELRTPLNSIIGFTGIMLQGLAGELNEEQEKQLGMVYGSAQHLLGLINDILDISKIEAGEVELVRSQFDISALIQEVVKIVAPTAQAKGLEMAVSISPQVGEMYSDRRRGEQILLNLVNNAIKFTEQGEVRIEARIADRHLEVSVQDTGIGIKEEDMGKLFQPFRQIDDSFQRGYEGTGLGLSICNRLVDLLGGQIWVESRYGVGSTFTFTLPLTSEQQEA